MVFIYSMIFVAILSITFTVSIKKNYKIYYALASVISIAVSIYEILRIISHSKLNGFILNFERAFITGSVGVSFFILVMFAGALSTKQIVGRKLMTVRTELSIIASILILPHGIVYFVRFLILKLPKILQGKMNSPLYLAYILIGIVAFIIMVPLFITSFKFAKRKLKGSKWKKLHRLSYVFYLLIYVHIMLVLLNGRIDTLKVTSYTAIFAIYTVMKIIKQRNIKVRKSNIQSMHT
ncbi:sulfite oxidase heme-binding subunit YedZ [Clostridium felsineum]|uniref:sulfite oxidase heme-binding subunit YedZ n=1 Tax=Clostridium felsineum TaxID=36839 RepID=UPI00214DC75A|nr:sulfite oxidase heme-binding subunit YedZ [Clostridium felsineum]MCR3759678.1 sulfite oxidase heme-binding subunit YedZ [Clostridium felsineum]